MAARFPVPVRNIHWDQVRAEKSPEVEERAHVFIYYRGGLPYAVVNWSSRDAVEAQQYLSSIAFKRCFSANLGHADCGSRLGSRYAWNCGNHEENRPRRRRK
jgi:hypothetical protein